MQNSSTKIYIRCSSPLVIFNKACVPFLTDSRYFIANGKLLSLSRIEIIEINQNTTPNIFKHFAEHIKRDHSLITRFTCPLPDGREIPLFTLVPCRHCPSCVDKRTREMQVRAVCENITSKTPPISVLLTYDNKHLPKDGVCKKHVDDFFKRLRIRLQRDGYNLPLRMLAVGEYGDEKHRPHYHLLLWNFPQFASYKYSNYKLVKEYIGKSWSFGWVNAKYSHDTDGKTSAATSYFVKYVYKGSNIPDGKNPTFVKCSRGRGEIQGLGSEWLKLNKDFYLKNTNTREIILYDKWSGTKFHSVLPRYFVDKLFPSISRIIPQDIRDKFKEYQRYRHLLPEYEEYMNKKYWFMPRYEPVPFKKLSINLIDNFKKLIAYEPKEINLELQQAKVDFATDFLENFNKNRLEIDGYLCDYWDFLDHVPKKEFKVFPDGQ